MIAAQYNNGFEEDIYIYIYILYIYIYTIIHVWYVWFDFHKT